MGCLTWLLSGLLIFIAVTVYSIGDENIEINLLKYINPQHYEIKIVLRHTEIFNIFFGECDINIQILEATREISMAAEKLSIISATLINNDPSYNKINKIRIHSKEISFIHKRKTVSFYFDNVLSPGYYTLNVKYSGAISIEGGFQQFGYVNNSVIWLSATHFHQRWIRRIFPCCPLSNSTFNISIKYPQEYIISSNMPIRTDIDAHVDTDNLQWTFFSIFEFPGKITIFMTNFIRSVIHEDDIKMWCSKESVTSVQLAMTIIKNIRLYLKDVWKYWRFSRVNYIVIPNFQEQNNDITNLENIVYNEIDTVYDEERDSFGHKYNVIYSVGNRVVREWFKSFNNPFYQHNASWWSEGFNMFFATHLLNQTFTNSRIIDLFVVQIQHDSLQFDDVILAGIYQNETVSDEIVKITKAPVILRMLQHTYTADVFWQSVHKYLDARTYNLNNFWRDLKIVYDEVLPGTYDIENMMRPWREQNGYPVLNISRNYKYIDNVYLPSSKSIKVTIERLSLIKSKWIPVTFTTQTSSDFNQTTPLYWFNIQDQIFKSSYEHSFIMSLNYKEDGWVIFNIQQTGYYRVNYDDGNWRAIAEYLNNPGEYWKIHDLNRAQIIDDAFYFLLLGKLKSDIFWQLVRYLSHEINFIPWYPMLKVIRYISSIFPFQEIGVIHIKEILQRILSELLRNTDYEEDSMDDFTKALRHEALQLACMFGDSGCLQTANSLLKNHLQTSIELTPWMKKWIYCYGLVKANNITWQHMVDKIKGDNDKIFYLLTCPNHLAEMNKYISASVTENKLGLKVNIYDENKSYVTPTIQIFLNHFHFIIINNTKSSEAFNNLLSDFKNIKSSIINMPAALLILINNIHSKKLLDQIYFNYEYFMEYKIYIHAKIKVRKNQLDHHMHLINIIKPTS